MSTNDFHPIDELFAKRICPDGTPKAIFLLKSLLKSAREGHMFLVLTDDLLQQMELPDTLFNKMLNLENNRLYLRRNWECESRFLTHLKRLSNQKPSLVIRKEEFEQHMIGINLNKEQKAAIYKTCHNTLTLISGGPGTGKTYTAAVIIRLFMEIGVKNIVVAAPTGKATANLRASLGTCAEKCIFKTLHALVKMPRLDAELIVVDEASMVDAERMSLLFEAVKEGARLVLVGDKDQLPPIESGNFFADLAEKTHLLVELKTCLRAELKEIIELACNVKSGKAVSFQPLPELDILLQQMIDQKMQVLTPLRKGLYGADHLNQLLHRAHIKRGAKSIPIMITVNDPETGLFNGDIGVIFEAEKMAYFSGGKKISEYLLPCYCYAYVLTVHKSQGSEYDKAMILLPKGSESFGREMLYTAITRAKKEILLFAHEGVIEELVKTQYQRRASAI